jgi:hypothetical protein
MLVLVYTLIVLLSQALDVFRLGIKAFCENEWCLGECLAHTYTHIHNDRDILHIHTHMRTTHAQINNAVFVVAVSELTGAA